MTDEEQVTTTVAAVMARSFRPDMFDDLAPLVDPRPKRVDGTTVLVFDGALDDETVTAIRDRMTSRDDEDQADRTKLRQAAAAGALNLAAMHLAYTLGDPVPDAVLPEPPADTGETT